MVCGLPPVVADLECLWEMHGTQPRTHCLSVFRVFAILGIGFNSFTGSRGLEGSQLLGVIWQSGMSN